VGAHQLDMAVPGAHVCSNMQTYARGSQFSTVNSLGQIILSFGGCHIHCR
jgi:hypothetical protein